MQYNKNTGAELKVLELPIGFLGYLLLKAKMDTNIHNLISASVKQFSC